MNSFPQEEMAKASIDTQAVSIGLVRSVDSEHGTRMDFIVPCTYHSSELGIIGDNSTNRQQSNRSTLSIVGYQLALETALSLCRLKTKSDDQQIELSMRTINKYSRMIVWRKIVLTIW